MSRARCSAEHRWQTAWKALATSMPLSPNIPKSRVKSWLESRPTEVFWCRPCWRPATRSTPSTLWPSTVTGIGMRSRERSRMRGTQRCWPSWSAPTATTTDRWRAILSKSRLKLLARAHQGLVHSRQRQVNQLRSALREFYPAALEAFKDDLGGRDAMAILEYAPTPSRGRSVSQAKLISALRKAGRERNLEPRAGELKKILQQPHLELPATLVAAYAVIVKSCVRIIRELNAQTTALEEELTKSFELHPDAELYLSLPGLGFVLGARVIGEFGDDPNRYSDAKGRRAYSGMAPITRASGTRHVVLARYARNRQLADACYLWAFSSLKRSAGAHQYYRALRARGKSHAQALRALGNRWVSILHGCLRRRQLYSEEVAWRAPVTVAA